MSESEIKQLVESAGARFRRLSSGGDLVWFEDPDTGRLLVVDLEPVQTLRKRILAQRAASLFRYGKAPGRE